ncbi:MAG: hypothetical protein WB870_03605 [Gallionellaceae bacterium]
MERSASSTSQSIHLVIHLAWPVLVAQPSGGCAALIHPTCWSRSSR